MQQRGGVRVVGISLVNGQAGNASDSTAIVLCRVTKVLAPPTFGENPQLPGGALVEDRPADFDAGIDPGSQRLQHGRWFHEGDVPAAGDRSEERRVKKA